MDCPKHVVIDGKNHLLGRLASTVAKELLKGGSVCIVRCEEICISGPFFRNKLRFRNFMNKRMATNPTRGPFHSRSPSTIFARTVRGMLPYKTLRGTEAFMRLKCFEGVPHDLQGVPRKVVPEAVRCLRLRSGRKFTRLTRISSEFGWKHAGLVAKLETERQAKWAPKSK